MQSPRAMVTSRPERLPKTMSQSVVLPKSGSLLMSMAHSPTKGHKDAQLLGHMAMLGSKRLAAVRTMPT